MGANCIRKGVNSVACTGSESGGAAVEVPGLDQLLEGLQVELQAFAVCEIGNGDALDCPPLDIVVMHFVLSGEGELECDAGAYSLQRGDLVVVPAGCAKRLKGPGEVARVVGADCACPVAAELTRFRAVSGKTHLVIGCAILRTRLPGSELLFESLQSPLIHRSSEPVAELLLSVMLHELQKPQVGTATIVSALMKQMVVLLLRSRDENAIQATSTVLHPRLATAVAAVLRNPRAEHKIGSLAALAGMSRSRFCHHFGSIYGCSPMAFVQTARLASAAKMLVSSKLPVKAISASVGYASRSHFSRAFQARYGVPPSAYRRDVGARP